MDYPCGGTRYEDDSMMNEKGIGPSKDNKSASKRGIPCTRGTAMSFGFRRRPTSGIPTPVSNPASANENGSPHQRSKSAEQNRKRDDETTHLLVNSSSSGRSTPRLLPPGKKDTSAANSSRANRFGYRQGQQPHYTIKDDKCSSHSASHYNQDKLQQQQNDNCLTGKHSSRLTTQTSNATQAASKHRQGVQVANNATFVHNPYGMPAEADKRPSGIPEPVNRYTLHSSHLPLPQYAVRVKDANTKIAKTATNQSRKVSTTLKGIQGDAFKDEVDECDQLGYHGEKERTRELDYYNNGATADRRRFGRPRNIRAMANGKSFDVRDVRDEDSTVTEISVIPLQKSIIHSCLSTVTMRERPTPSPRILDKDNRYTDLAMSMSTTSSEGYDERSGEEKVYKDRSRTEKIPSVKSDISPLSSDDPEYGHGEAMADEYSLSSSDECHHCKSNQQIKNATANGKTGGALPKNTTLRSVLLNIEDPAFAAVAATSTTLIDDETSPVDSLLDSPTASITQSDCKISKKDCILEEPGVLVEDDSPETPTNTSNSLSLSEGREFFDDEIADQPGLIFDDNSRAGIEQSSVASHAPAENSHTLVEPNSKTNSGHGKHSGKGASQGQRLSRAGSVDTLSPCESIDSDDLMLDYERSDTSSHDGSHRRLDSNPALHELDDVTILSELESKGAEVMRQWSLLLGTTQPQQQVNFNTVNNNITGNATDNNNQPSSESGGKPTRHPRTRSGVESPRSSESMRSHQISSPVKAQHSVSSIHSSSVDSGDEGSIRIERGTYQYMFQDIVSIKTMLLKLKRVLQEAETAAAFNNSLKNGVFYNINEGTTADVSTSPDSGASSIVDELADLRRQVVFLQGQIEDRDRTIQGLQFQMSKLQGSSGIDSQSSALSLNSSNISSTDTCNAATQTEKTRAVSAGPSLLHSLPQDSIVTPFVSWSDSWDNHQAPTCMEPNSNRRHRKTMNHVPCIKLRQVQMPNHSNGHMERLSLGNTSNKETLRERSSMLSKSDDVHNIKQYNAVPVVSTLKSVITPPKKNSTLIPRTARGVSFPGRPHNV